MSLVLTKTDFARALQCQPSYVTKIVQKGLVKVNAEGKILVVEALKRLKGYRNHYRDHSRLIDIDRPELILQRARRLAKKYQAETPEEFLWPLSKLARLLGVSTKTIRRHVVEYELPRREDGLFEAKAALQYYFQEIKLPPSWEKELTEEWNLGYQAGFRAADPEPDLEEDFEELDDELDDEKD